MLLFAAFALATVAQAHPPREPAAHPHPVAAVFRTDIVGRLLSV